MHRSNTVRRVGRTFVAGGNDHGAQIFFEDWEDGDHVGWQDFQSVSGGYMWGGIGAASGADFNGAAYVGHGGGKCLVLRMAQDAADTMYPSAPLGTLGANDTLYLSYWCKWSPNYQFNTHTNKNSYLYTASGLWRTALQCRPTSLGDPGDDVTIAVPYFHFYGPDGQGSTGEMDVANGSWQQAMANETGGDIRYFPNVAGQTGFHFVRDQWYHIEWMMTPNPSGQSFGGHLILWVDDVKIIEAVNDNVSVRKAASSEPVYSVWLTSYHGGGGQLTHPEQYVLYDDIKVTRVAG